MKESVYYKIRVFVPVSYAAKIRQAMNEAGASRQGNYDWCSGSYVVTGRFRPIKGAKPFIGKVGKVEKVKEETVETLCHKNKLKQVITAIKKVHPYEEPAIDIIKRYEV